ncbi:MAG TPA: hypothetical protein VGH38_24875 [Bryobacteraceae bacterium]
MRESSVFLQVEENPNCQPIDGMVFQPLAPSRVVVQLRYEKQGVPLWCDVAGVEEGGAWCPALACMVDDSGDGTCYLVYGGGWGLRLREASSPEPWDLAASNQWGAPYLLLGGDGGDLRFVVRATS